MNDDSALRRLVACCLTASGLSARARLNPEKARHLAAQIEKSFLRDAEVLWQQLKRPPAGEPVSDPCASGGASTRVHWAKVSADLLAAAEALWPVSALSQTG